MNLIASLIFSIGSVICHQLPDRSFFVDGHQFPVCARCTGLYLSGLIGLGGWWATKLARRWRSTPVDPSTALRLLVVAALPTLVSVAAGASGWWDGSNMTRAVLAIPLGASAGAIAAAVSTKDLR